MRRLTLICGSTGLALTVVLTMIHVGRGDEPKAPASGRADDAKAVSSSEAKIYGEWSIVIKADKGTEYNKLIEREGLPLFREAGGRMVGWWTTSIGDLYEQVTIWEYDGMPAFEKAGQFLGKDERFAKFVAQRDPLLAGERSRFLKLVEGAAQPALPDRSKFVVHEIHRVPFKHMEEYLKFMRGQIPILKQHGFRTTGPWQTAVGRWTEVTYLFSFDSLAERDRLIEAFSSHKDFQTYGKGVSELVDEVTTRILTPAPHAR